MLLRLGLLVLQPETDAQEARLMAAERVRAEQVTR
jgi:hypothetical protein